MQLQWDVLLLLNYISLHQCSSFSTTHFLFIAFLWPVLYPLLRIQQSGRVVGCKQALQHFQFQVAQEGW
jgi:hypothetical protein